MKSKVQNPKSEVRDRRPAAAARPGRGAGRAAGRKSRGFTQFTQFTFLFLKIFMNEARKNSVMPIRRSRNFKLLWRNSLAEADFLGIIGGSNWPPRAPGKNCARIAGAAMALNSSRMCNYVGFAGGWRTRICGRRRRRTHGATGKSWEVARDSGAGPAE